MITAKSARKLTQEARMNTYYNFLGQHNEVAQNIESHIEKACGEGKMTTTVLVTLPAEAHTMLVDAYMAIGYYVSHEFMGYRKEETIRNYRFDWSEGGDE